MKPALIGGIIFVMVILIIAVISFRSEDDAKPAVEEEEVAAQEEEPVTQEDQAKAMTEPTAPVNEEGEEEKKEEEEAAPPVATEEVAADEPDTDPTKVNGLVGHYTAESFDERANVWKDKSGNGNDADEVKGEPEVVEENGVKFLLGGSTSGVRFPSAVLTNGRKYTMIAVTKINSTGGGGGRLFDGYGNGANYVSGFHWRSHGAKFPGTGGAHRTGTSWIAHYDLKITGLNVDDWILTVDQKHSFRWNGIQRSGLTRPVAVAPNQMSINHGDYTQTEGSIWRQQNPEWSAAEVLFFNKELDLNTIRKIEAHLMKKYKIKRSMRPRVNVRNMWKYEKGAYKQTLDDCSGGSTCAEQFRVLDQTGADCGEEGAISDMYFHRHGSHKNSSIPGGNGRVWYQSTCVQGLQPGRTTKKTSYVNIADDTSMESKYKKFDMTCRGGALSNFEWEKSNDGSRMRINYGCSNTPVNEDSCREIDAYRDGLEGGGERYRNNERSPNLGPLTTMDLQRLRCGNGQVLTSVRYAQAEDGSVRYKGTCCNLQDE